MADRPYPKPPPGDSGGEVEVVIDTPGGPAIAIALTYGPAWSAHVDEVRRIGLEHEFARGHLTRYRA